MAALILLLMSVGVVPAADELASISAALRSAPGWRTTFVQRYLPAGLLEGIQESGTVILAPPFRLRFDYDDGDRVFATDGLVVRMVDPIGGTCDAFPLDQDMWSRTPLAALLDAEQTGESFVISKDGHTLRLVPRTPIGDVVAIAVVAGEDWLPATVSLTDASGNVNELRFSKWHRVGEPAGELFRPGLPGAAPCLPQE